MQRIMLVVDDEKSIESLSAIFTKTRVRRIRRRIICFIMLLFFSSPCIAASDKTISFSNEEKEYVANAQPITVGVIDGRYPFSGIDRQTGEISGMFVDLCELVAQKSGLQFNYALVPQGVRGVDWLEQGNGQIMAGVFYSQFNMPSDRLIHTDTLFSDTFVTIGRKGEEFHADAAIRVALAKSFIGGEQFIATQYPNSTAVFFDTDEECIDAIVAGVADIMYQDIYISNRQLQSPRYEMLTVFPIYRIKHDMKLVMLDDDNGLLLSVLNKAIDGISEEEIDNIILTHTVAKPYQYTLKDLYYRYRVPLHVIASLLVLVVALLIAILIVNKRHSNRIMAKNKELSEALHKIERSEERLFQAERDALTGLYNSAAFFAKAEEMIAAHEPGYYVLACFDIDKFKVINDQYGNEKGDEILRRIARIFDEGFSNIGGICGRMMADDFAVLYPASLAYSDAIDQMRGKITLPDGRGAALSYSVGRYTVDDLALPVPGMYDRALLAQAAAKGRFGYSIVDYDESMRERLLWEQHITGEMRSALKLNQFEVWYQPQYNHASGALIGSEALVRWRHQKDGRLIPPIEFISVFERNGFIYNLDQYVWEKTCSFLRRWIDEGLSPLPISVNISRYDLIQEGFLETLTAIVERYSIPLDLLRVEITESAFSKDTDQIVRIVKSLIEYGFTVEIDDFGSGYSSLNTLKDVPAQILKLDMRFLENSEDSDRGGNVLESVVRMAKWLGMAVIAEGVETIEQADYLKSIGCVYVQGYLYGMPMPADEYEALCKSAFKEEKLLAMQTVRNLNNNAFWDPRSMDTMIFNSFVGAANIVEYQNGAIELLRVSERFTQMLGSESLSLEDILSLDWIKYFEKESFESYQAAVARSIESGDETTVECMFTDIPGCPRKMYLRITLRVIASAGDRYLVYCLNENITQQRLMEEKERTNAAQLQAIMDNINGGVSMSVMRGGFPKIIYANEQFYQQRGYTKEQYEAEITDSSMIFHPDDLERTSHAARTAVGSHSEVYRIVRRDGATRWIQNNITDVDMPGYDERVKLSVSNDITQLRQAERKEHEVSERLQAILDALNSGVSGVVLTGGDDMRYVFANDMYYSMLGYTREQFIADGNNGMKLIHPDDRERIERELSELAQNGGSTVFEYRVIKRDGQTIHLRVNASMLHLDGIDEPVSLGVASDVTDIVEAQKKISDLSERLEAILENVDSGITAAEITGDNVGYLFGNDRFFELHGYTKQQYEAEVGSIFDLVHPDDRQKVIAMDGRVNETGESITMEYRIIRRDGKQRWMRTRIAVRSLPDAKYPVQFAVYADITDEKLAQERLQATKETVPFVLSAILASSTSLAFAKDMDSRYICASREFVKITNFSSADDIIGKTDYEIFPKEVADTLRGNDAKVLETNLPMLDYVQALPAANGALRYYKLSKYILRDTYGNMLGIYGIGRDITDEKSAYERLKLLVDSIPGGIASYIASPGCIRITYFNDGFCNMMGYTHDEYERISATGITNITFAEDVPLVMANVQAFIRDNTPLDCTYRVHTKSGGYKWVNLKGSVAERHGDICLFNTVLYDVTERIESENALRLSEEQFRIAADIGGRTVARYEIPTRVYHHQSKLLLDRGFGERIENVPQSIIDAGIIASECISDYLDFYDRIHRGESPCSVDIAVPGRNNEWRWLREDANVIMGAEGKPSQAIIVFSDITELREKETVFKKWQQSLTQRPEEDYMLFRCNLSKNNSFDSAQGKLFWLTLKPGVYSFNDRTYEYASQCVYESDRPEYLAFLNSDILLANYYRGVHTKAHEYREILPDRTIRWLRLTVELVEYPNSTDVEAFLLYENIDADKRDDIHIRELAQTDPLTGALNRASFSQAMERVIAQTGAVGSHALMMLDIDTFKLVNDTLGHDMGDQVLKGIADTLRSTLRHGDLLGRLGGDEFMILMRDVYDDEAIKKKARQICSLLRKSLNLDLQTSTSIGIAVCPRDGTDFTTLYRKADTALYKVKASGKNNYAFFDENMIPQNAPPTEHSSEDAKPEGIK